MTVVRYARSIPITLFLLIATWAAAIITDTTRIGAAVLATAGVLLVGPGERACHRLRFGAVALVAVAVTVLIPEVPAFSPAVWVCGLAAYGAASLSTLWRRRVIILLVAGTVTLTLFVGTLGAVTGLVATTIGGGVGWLVARPVPGPVSVREWRILALVVFVGVGIGPLIAGLAGEAYSIFGQVTALTWLPAIQSGDVVSACALDPFACSDARAAARRSGIGPALAAIMPLVIQIPGWYGFMRARRAAWWYLLVFNVMVILVMVAQVTGWREIGVYPAVDLGTSVIPWVAVVAVLGVSRRTCPVAVSRAAARRCAVIVTVVFALGGAVWLTLAPALVGIPFADALVEWPLRYLPPAFVFSSFLPDGTLGWALYEWLAMPSWCVVAFAFARMLRAPGPVADDRRRARALLHDTGGDHLQVMGLWEGNRYWFGCGGYVAYRPIGGIVVTVGEPVGADPQAVADGFEEFCRREGWHPAWYSVRDAFARSRTGFRRLKVAEESILAAGTPLKGKKFQNVRTAANRAKKEGISARWTTWAECTLVERERIIELSEEWVSGKSLPEMRFTLGTIEELDDPDTRLLIAEDATGKMHAVTSWLEVREYGKVAGLMLDMMRRGTGDGTFRSAIEFLFGEAIRATGEEGLEWVSLSGVPLAGSVGSDFLDRVLDMIGRSLEPLYGFRSLAASKNKFHPGIEPWYLLYSDELVLPAVGFAIARCYLPHLSARQALRIGGRYLTAQG